MPPSTVSLKDSPSAGPAALEMDLKDIDDINTHTSESVCSSSGTDAETTTNSLHAALHPPCLTAHPSIAESRMHAGGALSAFTRSPTSPMPCGFPEDFSPQAATAAISRGCSSTGESPTRFGNSPAISASAKRTPAPPPSIDFCGPRRQLERPAVVSSSCTPSDRAGTSCATGSDHGALPPTALQPDASYSVRPACVSSTSTLKATTTSSVLHAYSEPFHPQDRRCMGGSVVVGSCGGRPVGWEGGASMPRHTVSPVISPQTENMFTNEGFPLERHRPSSMVGFGSNGAGDEETGGLRCSTANTGGPPRLIGTSTRVFPNATGVTSGIGNAYDTHWQDANGSSYAYTPFNPAASAMDDCSGGGALGEEGYQPTSLSGVNGGAECSLLLPTPSSSFVRHSGLSGAGGGQWTSSLAHPMAVDGGLPTYEDPQPPFFREPPPLCSPPHPDYDYSDGVNVYDEGGLGDQAMRFGSYVPQDVQRVERLGDLECICDGLLAEAAAMEQHYHRRCRVRQYLSEDHIDEEALESKMVLALDLEGRSLGRAGSICIITLATYSTVYIIDMVLLGAQALDDGSALKALLESTTITKLMFDCRADCDALYHLYQIRLRGVCDLQISSCFALFPTARHLPGMKDVFRALGLFADEDTDIKNAGRHLFNPESGGSFDRWEERPLTEVLLQYCAVDVKYFFLAKLMLWEHLDEGFCLGEARLASVCAGNFVGCSKGNSLRDFSVC